ncbi:MAG: NAD-dependent protein deacetylase [Myxococcales bacterium]|nr:NAD-dependent protein deacetylase [Myxococcales bacterium]
MGRGRWTVLTGAGVSTESGIPDYRGPETARRARNPIQYKEFTSSVAGRQRYWARSVIGWPRFREASPNRTHSALAELERRGKVTGVITQNVDRLHTKAGGRELVELHGALAEVRCLGCGDLSCRDRLQERLLELNPGWDARRVELAPDGDAELGLGEVEGFQLAACERCGGVLKPNVVFFGEGVPRPVVDRAWGLFDAADGLLVAGSSLVVFSGFRFVRRAAQEGKPVAIVNLGDTRGHEHAALTLNAPVGEVFDELLRVL